MTMTIIATIRNMLHDDMWLNMVNCIHWMWAHIPQLVAWGALWSSVDSNWSESDINAQV